MKVSWNVFSILLGLLSLAEKGTWLMEALFPTGWGVPGADAPRGVCGRGDPGPG